MSTQPLSTDDISKLYRKLLTKQTYGSKTVIEGVRTVDLPYFSDESGYFMELGRFQDAAMKAFPDVALKQMNYSEMLPGAVKAAHLHLNQDDIWCVPPSHRLLIGLMDCREASPTIGSVMRFTMGAGKGQLLYIPRGVAHGASNVSPHAAAIIYFVNQEFTVHPEQNDEYRLPWDVFGDEFWEMSKE